MSSTPTAHPPPPPAAVDCGLEAAFVREHPPAAELRELSSRLRRLADVLPSLAKRSAALALPREDLPGMPAPKQAPAPPKSAEPSEPCLEPSLLPPQWAELTAALSLRPSEVASDDATRLDEARWELLRCGWLPALRSLCLAMSDIQRHEAATAASTAAEAGVSAGAGSTAASGGRSSRGEARPKAPTDLLSLRSLCHIHAALEVLVVWGIAKRLATPGAAGGATSSGAAVRRRAYGVLLPPTRPLTKTVAGALDNAQRVLQLRPSVQGGAGDGDGEEVPHLRRLRLWFCAVVLERTLRIAQLRPLLLPRYLPDLIAALLDLSRGGIGGGGGSGADVAVDGGSSEASSEARRLDSVVTEWSQGCLLNLLGQSQSFVKFYSILAAITDTALLCAFAALMLKTPLPPPPPPPPPRPLPLPLPLPSPSPNRPSFGDETDRSPATV